MARIFERKDPRKFEFKPRYWDPAKEEREERERRIEAELKGEKAQEEETGEDDGAYSPDLRGKLTEIYRQRREQRRGNSGRYAVRLFAVLIFVFLMLFFFMMKYGNNFIQSFM